MNEKVENLEKDLNDVEFTENEKKILSYLFSNQKITAREAAEVIDMSIVTGRNLLKKLKEQGILEWRGTSPQDPYQYYFLKKDISL